MYVISFQRETKAYHVLSSSIPLLQKGKFWDANSSRCNPSDLRGKTKGFERYPG